MNASAPGRGPRYSPGHGDWTAKWLIIGRPLGEPALTRPWLVRRGPPCRAARSRPRCRAARPLLRPSQAARQPAPRPTARPPRPPRTGWRTSRKPPGCYGRRLPPCGPCGRVPRWAGLPLRPAHRTHRWRRRPRDHRLPVIAAERRSRAAFQRPLETGPPYPVSRHMRRAGPQRIHQAPMAAPSPPPETTGRWMIRHPNRARHQLPSAARAHQPTPSQARRQIPQAAC
jgi:hypothetical protein